MTINELGNQIRIYFQPDNELLKIESLQDTNNYTIELPMEHFSFPSFDAINEYD